MALCATLTVHMKGLSLTGWLLASSQVSRLKAIPCCATVFNSPPSDQARPFPACAAGLSTWGDRKAWAPPGTVPKAIRRRSCLGLLHLSLGGNPTRAQKQGELAGLSSMRGLVNAGTIHRGRNTQIGPASQGPNASSLHPAEPLPLHSPRANQRFATTHRRQVLPSRRLS